MVSLSWNLGTIHSNSRFQIQFSRAFKCLMNFHRIHSHNRHTMKSVLFYSNGMIISWTEWISWLSMLITLAKTLFLQHFSVKCQRNQIASLENKKKIHAKYRAVQRSAVYFHSNIYILNDMWNVCGFTRTHFFLSTCLSFSTIDTNSHTLTVAFIVYASNRSK